MTTTPLPPVLRPAGRRARRRGRARRLAALSVVAVAAFGAGVLAGSRAGSPATETAQAWVRAWEAGDHALMHSLLSEKAARRAPLRRFARAYRNAAATMTLTRVDAGEPRSAGDGLVEIPVRLATRLFGTLSGTLRLPVVEEAGGKAAVDWRSHLVFPGMARGERLARESTMPPRAAILARDGTPLAEGPLRTSPVPEIASSVVGSVGPVPADRVGEVAARGLPEDATVGLTGLERELDARLAGSPGGVLRAGDRVIARAEPRRARPVRTTIAPAIQQSAVTALAGRFGGVVALRPRTGEVLGMAGIAADAPQPPGSTFKIVTLAGALDARTVRRSATYPVATSTTLEGVELENANGEACGGTLRNAFAHSCNSVFAPIGARLGAERLVRTAERFGFNREPSLEIALESTLPPAGEIGDDLAVGSTAIGQGRVLATALQMAVIGAAIADDGRRREPTVVRGEAAEPVRATSRRTARWIRGAMRAVVDEGTGVAAAIPGVPVAGKTGTAELRTTQPRESEDPAEPPSDTQSDMTDTDAWFVGFAPAARPKIAVAVLLVGQGAGGTTAAPAARVVLEAAVSR